MKIKYAAGGIFVSLFFVYLTQPAFAYTNELINPGFEQAAEGNNQKAYGWHDFHNGYQRRNVNINGTSNNVIRLVNTTFDQISGAYQRFDLQQTELKPVFIGGMIKGNKIANGPGGYFGASIYVEIHLQDGSVAYWNSLMNSGTFNWRWTGFNTGTLPHVNQPIDHIFVVPILSNATGSAFFNDIEAYEVEASQAALTIMIDDGETSTYTEAKPVLDALGYTASVAIPQALVGTDGYMSRDQIFELQTSGWEVVSHGLKHEDLTTMSKKAYTKELRDSKTKLEAMGFDIYNFALPFGAYNADIMAEGAKYYSSVRQYELGDNPMGMYPFEPKVRSMIDTTTPEEVNAWITSALQNNRWVILTFHTIGEGDDQYHTLPENFREILDVISESGISVMTYNNALQNFSIKSSGLSVMLSDSATEEIADEIIQSPILEPAPDITNPEEEPESIADPTPETTLKPTAERSVRDLTERLSRPIRTR